MSISDKYEKYCLNIVIEKKVYYTISGTDKEHSDDDVFLSNNDKIILFSSFDTLKKYVLDDENYVFDRTNFIKWLNEFTIEDIYATFNFDKFDTMISKIGSKGSDFDINFWEEMIDFIGFVKDVKYQFKSNDLEILLDSATVSKMDEILYEALVWDVKNQEDHLLILQKLSLKKELYTELKMIYSTVKTFFKEMDTIEYQYM